MLPILVVSTNRIDQLSGTTTHMYEIALYLHSMGIETYFLSITDDENMFCHFESIRYAKTIPIYTLHTIPQHVWKTGYNILTYMLYPTKLWWGIYNFARQVVCLVTDGIEKIITMGWSRWSILKTNQFIENTIFIYDDRLENEFIYNPTKYRNPKLVPCSWGISKHLKIENRSNGIWYIYARHNDNRVSGIRTYSNTAKIEEAIAYCKKHNMEYVLDTKKVWDPWNEYEGLLYPRNIDYSPRLPFEFGKANKPTICFDTSPGLRALAKDCTLYKPIVMETTKELFVPLEVFK